MTANPLADSQPKNAAPHLMPPKRARCTATASRAAPRVACAPSTRSTAGGGPATGGVTTVASRSGFAEVRSVAMGSSSERARRCAPPVCGAGRFPIERACQPSERVARSGDWHADRVTIVLVDVANVVGARPDGWWRDRPGATSRLLARLASLPGRSLAGREGGAVLCTEVVAVVEGEART